MNVLIVKLSSLGDVVQTMPVVADILTVHPHAQIDWVVEEAFAPLVARVQGVRRVIPIALRRWTKNWFDATHKVERAAFKTNLKSATYDVVMDCQGLVKSALVARLATLTPQGQKLRLRGSFANKSDACGYEWPVKFLLPNNQAMPKRIHAVARTRLLAAKMLGYQLEGAAQTRFTALPAKDITTKKVMFTHGTTRPDNEWSVEAWRMIAERLINQGYQIVLPQATDAELRFAQLLSQVHASHIQVLARLNLSELLDEMSGCMGVIGVDSGLSHMAVALGLPHVQIFSQDRAWRAGPLPAHEGGVPSQIAVGGAAAPTVEQVWQAWQQVSSTI